MIYFLIALILTGNLSAYGQEPTDGTIKERRDNGQIPQAEYDCYLSLGGQNHIGQEAILTAQDGRSWTCMIYDASGSKQTTDEFFRCLPVDSPFRTCRVAAEVDYYFAQAHPEIIRTAVSVTVRHK